MADMTVKMTFTLGGDAAAGVKAIEDSFLNLQKVVTGVNEKLSSFSGTSFYSGMVSGMKSATTEIGEMDRAMYQKLKLEGMEQSAFEQARGEASVIQARIVAQEKLAIEKQLTAEKAIEQTRQMESQRAAWAQEDAARKEMIAGQIRLAKDVTEAERIQRAAQVEDARITAQRQTIIQNRQYEEHIAAARAAAQERVAIERGANDQIKGMAALYAAFKIEKGLTASVNEATKFQTEEIRVKLLNMPAGEAEKITQNAFDTSKALGFASALDVIIARQQVMGGLAEQMDSKILDQIVPQAMKAANVLKMMGDTTPQEKLIANLIGMGEARGQTHDPAAMMRNFDLVVKAQQVSHGKLTASDWEVFLRGMGLGRTQITDQGMLESIPMMEQMKVFASGEGGGGGGGGVKQWATAYKMLTAYMMGKPMNKQGAAMLEETGIFQPNSILPGSTTTSANIKGGASRDAKLASEDLPAFMQKYLPNIMAYTERHANQYYAGKDVKKLTDEDKNAALQQYIIKLGVSVTAASAIMMMLNKDNRERMARQVEQAKRADGVDGAQAKIDDSQVQTVRNYHAALDNLALVMGDKILPILTPLIKSFTELLNSIVDFSRANPFITQMGVMGAAIGGVALAISGFKTMFGIIGGVADMFKLMGGAAKVAALEVDIGALSFAGSMRLAGTSALAAGEVAMMAGKMFLRAIPVIGIAALVIDLVANFDVGGVKIKDWIISWGQELAVALGLMTEAEAKLGRIGAGIKETGGNVYVKNQESATDQAKRKTGAISRWAPKLQNEKITQEPQLGAEQSAAQLKPVHDYSGIIKLAEDTAKLENTKNGYKLLFEALKRARDEDFISRVEYAKAVMSANESLFAIEKAELQQRKKDLEEKGQIAAAEAIADSKSEAANAPSEKKAAILRAGLNRSKEITANMVAGSITAQGGIDRAEENHKNAIARQTESLPKELAADEIGNAMKSFNHQLSALQDAKEKAASNPKRTKDQQSIDEYAITQQEIAAYDDVIAKLEDIKKLHPEIGDAAQKEIDSEMKARDKMQNASVEGYAKLLGVVTSGFDKFLNDMTQHGQTLRSLFKTLLGDIASGIGNIIKQNLAQSMAAALGFGTSPQNSSGLGGVMGAMLNTALGGGAGGSTNWQGAAGTSIPMMGGGTGYPAYSGTALGGAAPVDYTSGALSGNYQVQIPKLAVGTNYVPQDMMAMIHKGEAVIPAAFNASGYGQKGGDTHVHQYISVNEPTNTRTQGQIAAAAGAAVRTASARNR